MSESAKISQLKDHGESKIYRPVPIDVLRQKLYQFDENGLNFNLVSENKIEIIIPVRTVSEANCFEPWRKKHNRHKAQKKAVFLALLNCKHHIRMPCTIKLTRMAPKFLDAHDNLRIALKYVLDQTCAEITNEHRPGKADGKEGFTFEYDQEKSKKYAVKIEIIF